MARAGRREPLRREQERGPQHQVKPAASSDEQWGSRAAHFTAKATSTAQSSGVESAVGPSGVRGAARVQGAMRNRRGPSVRPVSGRGDSYKPKAKSSAVQRESEGAVRLSMAAQNNAAGGKGPWDGHVGEEGKREGMDRESVPNSPGRRRPLDKVRQLQRRLWAAAKRQPARRFHALYDRIFRGDVLKEAWKRVKKNRGSAGLDAQTLKDVEEYGIDRFLEEIGAGLKAGTYRPSAVMRRYIPKADGKKRPLGIPTVRDRVVQMAAKLVLEPIFEADFRPCSYGFRPRRSATQALERLRKLGAQGYNHVLDADIRDYFGSIDHERLPIVPRSAIACTRSRSTAGRTSLSTTSHACGSTKRRRGRPIARSPRPVASSPSTRASLRRPSSAIAPAPCSWPGAIIRRCGTRTILRPASTAFTAAGERFLSR